MRKTIIALMLILPLMFIFVLFSSANIASLGVNIAVNGIRILNKGELGSGTLRIDLAEELLPSLDVAVMPENASNKGFTFAVEPIEGSDFADVSVSDDGVISAKSAGAAKIFAVSNDGGFRDSISVLVGSSKAYDFEFSLVDALGSDVELSVDEAGNYFADVSTGRLSYFTRVFPSGFTSVKVESSSKGVEIDAGERSILLAFGGKAEISVTVPDGVKGDITKTVTLNATKAETYSGVTINGGPSNVIAVAKGARLVSFYVESDVKPTLVGAGISNVTVTELGGGCYKLDVTFEGTDADVEATLSAGTDIKLDFVFRDFDFALGSDLPTAIGDEVSILVGSPVTFYAVAAVPSDDITYVWGVDGIDEGIISPSEATTSCAVNATAKGEFVLWVEAYKGGSPLGIVKQVKVSAIAPIYGVSVDNDLSTDLAARYTVGGLKYSGSSTTANKFELDVMTYYDASGSKGEKGCEDLICTVSDEKLARLTIEDGRVYVTALGTGEVTFGFAWKGNETFGANYSTSVTLNVVRNAVEVASSSELFRASKEGREIVLTSDIMLGTDENGNVLDESSRKAMLGRMKSTYNIDWYIKSGAEKDAYVSYVLEFKDDVYGNGHTINAEHFTNATDGTGTPLWFRGPLYFVSMASMASVAGQDNCAFLVRTDGVRLYGVNLLGCSDESLMGDSGEYDLTMLNNVGTVLEINADVEIVNCRIRNGRNVVRAFGGNEGGNRYFIDSLADNVGGVDNERINVTIDGCVISRGREFLLKVGANRALRASENVVGKTEPDLLGADGKPYSPETDAYLTDEYFYRNYVMTDLTVRDTVLETSGLFSIGVETNFAGSMLYSGLSGSTLGGAEAWPGTGGTSFASVLRLIGDVRMYDWKALSHVDSSTLIESGGTAFKDWLRLDVGAMIDFVRAVKPEYGKILYEEGGEKYVHGGIALYGGGKNYSQVQLSLGEKLNDLKEYKINISVLADSPDNTLSSQGKLLPSAAGTRDFRFFMYDADSENSLISQRLDEQNGSKYAGVTHKNVF